MQMQESIKVRLDKVTADFMKKHNLPFEDVSEFIQDISTILFDHMGLPLVDDEDRHETRQSQS